MSQIQFPPQTRPTKATIDYLTILFHDINYTREQSLIFCRAEFHRPSIKYLDDLTPTEASHIIERLKEIRRKIRSGTAARKDIQYRRNN